MIALIIAIIGVFTPFGQGVVKSFGNVGPQNCGGTVTCFTDVAAGNVYTTIEQWLGGSTDATAKEVIVNTGTCAPASATMFTVANPFASIGTSTAEVQIENIVGQATSTTFSVSTSTSAGLAFQTTAGLINSALVATSTSGETVVSGVTYGSNGATSAGTNSQGKLLVAGPDYVSGYATSTYTDAVSGYVAGMPCQYKITWTR